MTKRILLIAMCLFKNTFQDCATGCLSCDSNESCILCDFLSGFFLKDNSCQKTSIENCTQLDLNGQCLSCSPSSYLDSSLNKCVPVQKANLQDSCIRYESDSVCSVCKNTYPLQGKCIKNNQFQIANCSYYSAPNICSECSSGY